MPKYTNTQGKINLKDYRRVKELTNGKTNQVSLWEHKDDSNLKIVVKIPNGLNSDLVQHNIRSINTFFGEDSAWPIDGKIDGKQGFAMKYYQGKTLTLSEEENLVNENDSPIRTINKNGLLFTILDPNRDNFLKLPTGSIIPIDHDYMIIHDGRELLPYQKEYLDGRMGYATRMGGCSTEEAVKYVLDSYPAAASYLYEHWGKKYVKTDKYASSLDNVLKPVDVMPVKNINNIFIENAQSLLNRLNLTEVKITSRVKNYRVGNDAHNKAQPLESIQFDFTSAKARDLLAEHFKTTGNSKAILYCGEGYSEQPILQISVEYFKHEMARSKLPQYGFFCFSEKQKQSDTFEEPIQSNLSEKQLQTVNELIEQLQNEYTSCWPYPNKPLKLEKIGALTVLRELAKTMSVAEALQSVKDNYPEALQGKLSARTASLFDTLSHENIYELSV